MRNTFTVLALISIIVFALFSTSYATIEWNLLNTYNIEVPPVDMAISKYGRWVFVLTEQGEVLIYSRDGALDGKIPVGNSIDGIKPGPSENTLLLSSRKDKTAKIIAFDFIQNIHIDSSPYIGPIDAPVVVAVFADFQCAACAGLSPLLEQVLETYPKDVKLVFKNYPLDNHKYARKAAVAALAAGKQGRFWEFHDLLFANQAELNDQKIKEISESLGLDWEKLSKDMKNPEIIAMVNRDKTEGDRIRMEQVPSVFINGRRLKSINMQGFRAVIEYELTKLGKRGTGSGTRKTFRQSGKLR